MNWEAALVGSEQFLPEARVGSLRGLMTTSQVALTVKDITVLVVTEQVPVMAGKG